MNISCKSRTKCAVCGASLKKPLIKLPDLPLTDIYTRELSKKVTINQNFYLCPECGHGELSELINPKVLYANQYSFRTSRSKYGSVKENEYILEALPHEHFNTILEVGCNDMYLLKRLESKADRLIGIDPILENKIEGKITAIGDFIENIAIPDLNDKSLILTSQLLEHIEEPKQLLERLLEIAHDDTVFVFGLPCFDILLERMRFDQIYHHHLHYFSVYSFSYMLNELNCEILDISFIPHYWGTMIIKFKKGKSSLPRKNITEQEVLNSYNLFKMQMSITTNAIKTTKGSLYGYGAGLQVPVLNYHLKGALEKLECIIDDDETKDGLYHLNLDVPIRSSYKRNLKNKTVVVTAVNFSRNILKKIIPLNPKKIILPFNNM